VPTTHPERDPESVIGTHPSAVVGLHRTLEALGVEYLFGMDAPAALQAELSVGGAIQPITVRDERSAAFMADGYAKISGRPGVLGIGGVGATNTIQGVVEAWLGSTPIVLVVEEGSAALRHKNDLQDVDRAPLFAPITKWVGEVERPERMADLTAHAFRVATTGRPGPVYLGCPWDVVSSDTGPVPAIGVDVARVPADRVAPDPAAVERVAALIAGAKRPAIIAGGGVVISGATDELRELAHAMGAPVAATPAAKGAFDETGPLSAGVVGSYTGGEGGHGRVAHDAIHAADLVLLVGTATGSGTTASWTVPDPTQSVIHLDIDPGEVGRNYPASIPLVGDAKLGLDALGRALGSLGRSGWWRRADEPTTRGSTAAAGTVSPDLVFDEIQRALDDDTAVVADAGYCAAWALDRLRFRATGRRFLGPSAYGTLGYGLPAAIGAKLAAPGSTVICVTGDGGIGFSLGELETAARLGVAVTVIVLNNGGFGWSRHYDHHFYGYEGQTSFADVDHAAVARALGCEGYRVADAADYTATLAKAIGSATTTVLDVVIDRDARPPVDMFD
jgi:acetolactate synthase-1/2/3 large subunit